ncbi:MAG TPA: glycosyltransferase family 4 protein [Verrucomicrobiae bacterium]|jgi:glycosyltransferase involved in cell wall biosynthesis
MSSRPSVAVITNQTSPYQVEFMDAIAREAAVNLRVVYLHSQRPGRNWSQPAINHPHVILDGDRARLGDAFKWVSELDLVVIGYYRDALAQELIRRRAGQGTPWCFWGERPGVTNLGWAGAIYRRWKLRWLHRSRAGIWGIGGFALDRYRREFGLARVYCNVPYFSNLSRFQSAQLRNFSGAPGIILYSGSFIERKGVDLLARAFRQVSNACPNLRLVLLGDGPLRAQLERDLAACAARVTFAGFKDWSELPKFYHEADVLCVPSRHDGWGLVVPEGLAAGLPVIGTRRTGAALELITPDSNGWLIDAGDAQQLAATLEKVSALSGDRLREFSNAALATVSHHTLEDGVKRFNGAVAATLAAWN